MGVIDMLACPVWMTLIHDWTLNSCLHPHVTTSCGSLHSYHFLATHPPPGTGVHLAPLYCIVQGDQTGGLNSWEENDERGILVVTAHRPCEAAAEGSRVPATNDEVTNYANNWSANTQAMLLSFLSSLPSLLNCLKGCQALSNGLSSPWMNLF